jgi:hypothetical protein
MNTCYCVNMRVELHDAIAVLKALPGLEVRCEEEGVRFDGERADAFIDVQSTAGISRYVAEVKTALTTSHLPATLAKIDRYRQRFHLRPLLVAPHLTPGVSRRLLDENVEFVDGAGNVFLDGPAAYVLVLDRKPAREPSASGFTTTDLQLIFAFLARPRLLKASYREISAASGVSLGKISSTVRKLRASNHLRQAKSGALLMRDPEKLLERWESGYLEQLRTKLNPRGWRLGPDTRLEDVYSRARIIDGVLIGGEFAADALTGHLKPASLTLHVPQGQAQAVAAELRLARASSAPDVTLLDRFVPQHNESEARPIDETPVRSQDRLVNQILIRGELLALDDDRLREIAERLLDQFILKELHDAGA